jgi:hypothetical protein
MLKVMFAAFSTLNLSFVTSSRIIAWPLWTSKIINPEDVFALHVKLLDSLYRLLRSFNQSSKEQVLDSSKHLGI